jgi:type IV pilus assembly protein PilA
VNNIKRFCSKNNHPQLRLGFTLIELMIVVAIIAIILTLALPVYSDYIIRTKTSEALSVATAAKTTVGGACLEDPSIPAISSSNTGYTFGAPSSYVDNIALSGPCVQPVIAIQTVNTGATTNPVITITGSISTGRIEFLCSTDGQFQHVPLDCRNVTP